MMQKIAMSTAVVLSVIVCALALWAMHEAVLLLIIALAISAGMTPLIDSLIARGLKRLWAITLTFGGVLLPLIILLVLLGIQVVSDLALLIDRAPPQYNQMRQLLLNESTIGQYIGRLLPDSQSILRGLSGSNFETLGLTIVNTITQALVIGILLLSVASLGFYWLADQQRIERLLLSLLPTQHRSVARSLWNHLYHDVGVTIRGELVLVVCGIVSLFIGYWALGINGASLLALFGGLMLLVPVLSVPLALLPAVLIAGIQSPLQALLTLVGGSAILLLIKRFIGPRVFQAKTTINPVLVIVLIMGLAEVGGFWAFLAALPLAAAIQAIGNAIRAEQQRTVPMPQSIEVQELQERIDRLAQQIGNDQPAAVRIKGLLGRAQKVAADVAALVGQEDGPTAKPAHRVNADQYASSEQRHIREDTRPHVSSTTGK